VQLHSEDECGKDCGGYLNCGLGMRGKARAAGAGCGSGEEMRNHDAGGEAEG
jgi:hypothetical protein